MFQKILACNSGGGGSKGIELAKAPDAIYTNANMSSGATATLSVTQKPRLLILVYCSRSSSYDLVFIIYNVETGDAWRLGYWNSTWYSEPYTAISTYFTSVTSSSVGIINPYGGSVRMQVTAYY